MPAHSMKMFPPDPESSRVQNIFWLTAISRPVAVCVQILPTRQLHCHIRVLQIFHFLKSEADKISAPHLFCCFRSPSQTEASLLLRSADFHNSYEPCLFLPYLPAPFCNNLDSIFRFCCRPSENTRSVYLSHLHQFPHRKQTIFLLPRSRLSPVLLPYCISHFLSLFLILPG